MRDTTAWLFLLVLGIVLIAVGVQGSLGRVVAVIFSPAALDVTNDTETPVPGGTGGGSFE